MAEVKIHDAGQQVRVAIALCDRLGLEDALKQSRKLTARAQQLGEVVRRGQVDARRRRAEQVRELVNGSGSFDLPAVLETLAATDPWLDDLVDSMVDGSRSPRAVGLVMEAARACHGNAYAAAVGEGPSLYRRL